ncbi:MAG: helix-hairpin-helix domain-containing protein [Cyclobacteriaceae bacterium]|nr:helix-hairpin-helix domain-containing protein [Cyclobacteriaceae bacterium HetDA_MAG_MS6]
MKRLRLLIINHLGFNKREANGALLLITIVIATALLPRIYFFYLSSNPKTSSEDTKLLQDWVQKIEPTVTKKISRKAEYELVQPQENKTFRFNPNTASQQAFLDLGFKKEVANRIIKYREAGGKFQVRSDLAKIYDINQVRLSELQRYIDLPESKAKSAPRFVIKPSAFPKKEIQPFEINEATTQELQQVKGIGPTLSKRITKFRDALGGFHSKEQLKEVYGLEEDVLKKLTSIATLDSNLVAQKNINTTELKQLATHPYFDWNVARAIINFRKAHGPLENLDQIKEIKIISDSLYQKIYPYISLEP